MKGECRSLRLLVRNGSGRKLNIRKSQNMQVMNKLLDLL